MLSLCRIIEPLASRCAKFRFKPLSEEIMSSRITYISNEEGLNLDAEVCIYLNVCLEIVTSTELPSLRDRISFSFFKLCQRYKVYNTYCRLFQL